MGFDTPVGWALPTIVLKTVSFVWPAATFQRESILGQLWRRFVTCVFQLKTVGNRRLAVPTG